jgi:hypothetical protein
VRGKKPTRGSPAPKTTGTANDSAKASPPADFSELPPEKRQLAKKLANVGVWAGRIAELLSRFSLGRIRANFQLYRYRAASVERPGAWLYSAVTQGYALPSSGNEPSSKTASSKQSGPPDEQGGALPDLGAKVSDTRKRELIRAGLATEKEFDKFKDFDDPDRKQHFYCLE